ncbi:MAG TPA: hypothetical protein VLC09_08300 [Polyangiaceae bacterium]|nr:hypothetical protein [Polyangiaceae bacterium]
MERRLGLRGRTDVQVTTTSGLWLSPARGIELSGSGILLDRGRPSSERDDQLVLRLAIVLPERHRPIEVIARPVRREGYQQALRFVSVSDVDRLCLAEHLDLVQRAGGVLH